MKIKQDPVTGLWCREDGAILLPPNRVQFKKFRWSFGLAHGDGYLSINYKCRAHLVHRIICRAFNGLPPKDKREVDHINRRKDDNRAVNLHWVSRGENMDNTGAVDKSVEMYGIRSCDDRKAYARSYNEVHRAERKAHAKAYDAARRAEKRAQGLRFKKGPDGKWGWHPIKRA